MISKLNTFIEKRIARFLEKRLKKSPAVTLTQRRIFIFPGRIGLFYIAMVSLMFVTAINYQNNLLFAFSCILVGLFVSAIAFTYGNLSGLRLAAGRFQSVFAGEKGTAEIKLSIEKGSPKEGLYLGLFRREVFQLDAVRDELSAKLSFETEERGYVNVPRFTLYSHYPLGLLRCWIWVKLDFDGVVYPKPIFRPFKKSTSVSGDEEDEFESDVQVKGQWGDDFYGFKPYQAGHSLKHVAWRHFAKTSQLLTKEFSSAEGSSRWLDWDALKGVAEETRLQILCGWVLTAHDSGDEFGLLLPDGQVDMGAGEQHKKQCLERLAMHGLATKEIVGESAFDTSNLKSEG